MSEIREVDYPFNSITFNTTIGLLIMARMNNPASTELKAILDVAGAMIITTDLAGTVQIFNPAAERLLGWSADEVVGRFTPALWHDTEEVAARAEELSHELGRTVLPGFEVFVAKARDQLDEQRQWTFIRKDGGRFPVQLVVSAVRDAAGTVTGYVGTAQNLTARVEAEQERDRFFNVSLDMLGIANTDGYFKRINPTFSRVLGWTDEEFLSRPFFDFVHPDDRASTLREVEKLASGEPTLHLENRYLCKDGSWRWITWTCTPQPDGRLYATGRDVTKLKRAEEVMRQSQQDLAITLNSIGDAVIATDASRRITRMNPIAVQMTGWPLAEAVGRPIDEVFCIIHEVTRRPAVIPVDDVLATGTVHGLANHTVLISRDGTEWQIADSAAPICDDAGQITGVVLVFRDVAEERRLERELQRLNADLERRIEDRTRTLAESERRLRNGHRVLETLTSDASLEETLGLIARSVETEDPTALCSILLLDEAGKHLLHGAAPSLPDFYNQAIHGIEIGEGVGSCGTAAATKCRAISDDIRTHPGWAHFRSLVEKAGLCSCWSEPILADSGQVLGTFAIYHREPRTPNEKDIERIQWAASFVRLAIERKQAQAKLVENERFTRATLDALSAHVAVLDADGNIAATNRAWKTFAEENDSELHAVSKPVNYLAVCDKAAAAGDLDAAAAAAGIRDVIAGREEVFIREYPCHSTDEQRWFYCRVTRFPPNGDVYVVVAHENISLLKQTRDQLIATEARFESLSQVSPVGITLFDARGACIDTNRRWCDMTGLEREDALGTGWVEAIHEEDRDTVVRKWRSLIDERQPFQSEHRLCPRNGHVTWVYCESRAITGVDGQATGYIRTITDVSRQKVTETALRVISAELTSLSGTTFFDALVVQLSTLLNCDITAVCRHHPRRPDELVTIALYEDGEIRPNVTYAVEGTPCAAVRDRRSFITSDDLVRLYPDDLYLHEKNVAAYAGVAIIGSTGRPLGHLVAMSRRAWRNPEDVETILQLFAMAVAAELERQQSAQCFSDLFELSIDAFVLTDGDGRIIQANRQFEKIFGWKRNEILGESVDSLVPADRSAAHAEMRRRYLEHPLPRPIGSESSDLHGVRKDGSTFPVEISLSPLNTENGLVIAAAVRDISERRQAELALREEKVFSEAVIKSVSGLFYVLDRNGALLHWNHSMQDLLGLTDNEMHQIPWMNHIHVDDRSHIADKLADVFASGYAEAEARLLTKEGIRHVLLNGRKFALDGETHVVGVGIDITERKNADEKIRRLNQTLEERVQERTAELSAANAELVKVSQTKSEFLATMSHELRTPLNGVLGMNELLLATDLDERQRKYAEASNSSGKLLLGLINDILDLSKIESGKLELDPIDCDLESLVYDVADILMPAAQQKGLTLTCRLAPNACVIGRCDDNRLRQVLVNLVSNAIKFTHDGGVTIVGERFDRDNGHAVIRFSIADTGIGIPEARRHRLFEAFSQIDSSTTRRYGGTGLGLSICRQLIELMGGVIGVDSQIGLGSNFWFEIPVEVVDNLPRLKVRRQLLDDGRILVVLGPDGDRWHVSDFLASWSCDFVKVDGLRQAVGLLSESTRTTSRRFRVVLIDSKLAAEADANLLRELTAQARVSFIVLGTSRDDFRSDDRPPLRVHQLLPDPIRPSSLFDAISSTLSLPHDSQRQTEGSASSPAVSEVDPPLNGHVLVAEDNRINQLYIVEMLKHLGCTSDIAVNGEEAVAAARQQSYDLILMDCQMPEMDGFTASRLIRKLESSGEITRRVAIVALTANALKGDRERCLEAGMDDYVSKPVDGTRLRQIIAKHLSLSAPSDDSRGDGI